jgi:hypothetical protein
MDLFGGNEKAVNACHPEKKCGVSSGEQGVI